LKLLNLGSLVCWTEGMDDQIPPLSTGDLLAIRRLLWDIGASETTQHDQKVECYHWAALLDHLAGMPPWPTPGLGNAKVIAYYEGIRQHIDDQIRVIRESEPPDSN
jgi:hypothetical protein